MSEMIAVFGSALASYGHSNRDGDDPLINKWGFVAMFLFLLVVCVSRMLTNKKPEKDKTK